jgi:hypothetical protein
MAAISKGPFGPLIEEGDVVLLIDRDNGIRRDREEACKK